MKHHRLSVSQPMEKLIAAIDEALSMVKRFSGTNDVAPAVAHSPASLLDQCLSLCAQHGAAKPEPIRMLHQFACTGGTLISKCIAAMPNVQLLSEVDPLSTMQQQRGKPAFDPTDIVTLLRQSTRGVDTDLIIALFLNSLEIVFAQTRRTGQRLVLRDHAHSHFCIGSEILERPSVREIVASRFPAVSVMTVRHPLDSFLSLKANGWLSFSPPTFDEYCQRYVTFLRSHGGVPLIRYEDFVRTPQEVMSGICTILDIAYSEQFIDLFSAFRLTGDSGRSGGIIQPRLRRPLDQADIRELHLSAHYQTLQGILKYDDSDLLTSPHN